MTTRRPRAADVAAPSAEEVAPIRRTRAVPSSIGERAPTTAQLIRRSDASVSRLTYAALGAALHHFTDVIGGQASAVETHRATTVLTKQIFRMLEDHDELSDQHDGDSTLAAIRRLVTDPGRTALPDGRTAGQWCAQVWDDVRTTAEVRATASCDGAVEFGYDAIVNLAAVRGVGADAPWWGTPAWRQRVEQLPADTISSHERDLLLDEPELADDHLVSMVLFADPVVQPHRRPGSTPPTPTRERAQSPTTRATAVLAS